MRGSRLIEYQVKIILQARSVPGPAPDQRSADTALMERTASTKIIGNISCTCFFVDVG
jgi:hypothetical protein